MKCSTKQCWWSVSENLVLLYDLEQVLVLVLFNVVGVGDRSSWDGALLCCRNTDGCREEFNGVVHFIMVVGEGLAAGAGRGSYGIRGEKYRTKQLYLGCSLIILLSNDSSDCDFPSQCRFVFGGGSWRNLAYAGSSSWKFTVLLNGYLPVPDVRDYIVTSQLLLEIWLNNTYLCN